ncbi:hypothetical protein ACHAPF_011109, partial [Botrytis cinerea]
MPEVYKPTTSNLWYLFHHVFLPPKLPNGDDRSAEDDIDLLKIVQDSLDDFSCVIGEEHRDVVRGLYRRIDRMRYTRNINGYLDEDRLYEGFKKPINGTLFDPKTIVEWALEVTEQNAGLLIRKSQDRAIFEPFKRSPDNASIMTTRGRLIRQFPSVSVSVPADVIEEPGFNQVIASTLATMSYQPVPGMRPQVMKAKQCHDEERDTIKPDVVTEFLVGFLFSLGCQTNQQGLCTNTREEVMWNSSKLPWRRSPTWLLVRVTLQLTMNRATAHKYYENSPEGSSQMLLTILELWIAIDKCAITDLPLLKDYDHEIPTEVFQSLLLCRLHDMERLNRIEGYIEQRNVFSRQKSCPSIFRAYNDAQCFSIRYFFGSVKHQIMLRDIETQAKADRSAKDDELKVLQEKYRKLMELHSQSECEYYEVIDKWGDPQELHSTSCVRCGYEARAKQLMIKVHEWPLPSSIPAKQAVVVELDPPIPLQVWRDATIFLIQDVLGSFCSNELGPRAQYALRDYHGLRNWQVPSIRGRIHLLSEVKPHFGTHRKNRTVESLGESDICLNNGLKFLYFDGENDAFMSKLETSKAFLRNYLIKLPERSKELEKFISRTCARPNGEELNKVIASQPQFLSHMKLNEGKALASIPCVYKLQWMSILRELTSPQIDLNKVETAIIVAQICLQTGPALSGHICRASHIILTDNRFVSRLLEALNKHIARIEENLESGSPYTASILIEASIIARDNLSAKDDEDSLQYLLLDRWHRNTHRTSPIAIGQISNYENYCLDLAIKQYWPGYVPKLGWHASSSAEYWLENSSTTVHYNTLTGRLLVHGSPLLYLPADILARESYVRLFGRSLINVMPSNIKGMEFSCKRVFQDHTVHFSRQAISKNSNSLLIRAIKRGKVYDFIPSGIIAGLIPESFINDFVHWYHHDKEEVEFRPIVSPWISSKDNWRLVSEGPKWKLIHDNNDKVVDPSSATAKSICKIFGVLDNVLNQNVVYSPIKNDLSILLPRLRISFFIRNMSDSIESHQFRGIQVDEQQFIGILVGLESKFTLRSSDGSEDRLVLVPNGQIIFEKKDVCTTEPHTCVSIKTDRVSGVQSYSIDGILGRLMNKGTLKSVKFH